MLTVTIRILLTFGSTNFHEVDHILVLQQLQDLNFSECSDGKLNEWCKKTPRVQ